MSPRRRSLVVAGVVAVLLAFSTLLVVRQLTPASAETTAAAMSLGVVGGPTSGSPSATANATPDTTNCNGARPTTCTFSVGSTFNLALYVDTIPSSGGYFGIQTDVRWTATSGPNLTYRAATGEFVWCARAAQLNPSHSCIQVPATALGSPTTEVLHGAATNTSLDLTTLTGLTLVIRLRCPAGPSTSNVKILPLGATGSKDPGGLGIAAFQDNTRVIAAKQVPASLTINCAPAPTAVAPTEPPAATATPALPTTGSGAAGGGSNGGLWMIIGALAVLGAAAGLGIGGWRQVRSRT